VLTKRPTSKKPFFNQKIMEQNSYLRPYTEEEKKKIEEKTRIEERIEASKKHYGVYLIVFCIIDAIHELTIGSMTFRSSLLAIFAPAIGLGLDIIVLSLFVLWIIDLIQRNTKKA
jgi:hypothetical protein